MSLSQLSDDPIRASALIAVVLVLMLIAALADSFGGPGGNCKP